MDILDAGQKEYPMTVDYPAICLSQTPMN